MLRRLPSLVTVVLAAACAGTGASAGAPQPAPRLDPERTAFVFIEFQNEWVAEDGALRTLLVEDAPQFQSAIDTSARVLDAARRYGWTIAHALLDLRGDPAYAVFGPKERALGLRRAIQEAGTWTGDGAQFPATFAPLPGEYVTAGRSGASVLTNSTLDAFLRNNDVNTIIFLGFATHVCVESSVRQAHDLGYNALVVRDGVGAFRDTQNAYFFEHVLHHFGAAIESDALIEEMRLHSPVRN